MKKEREQWGSKLGLVLAMAGNAVGLGNFLRFPMQAARNGGGAFMIPYVIAFLLLGLPLMFVEWSMGRFGGGKGHATLPGIFGCIKNSRLFRWLGVMGVWIPLFIASYYVFIESWALGYSFFSFFQPWGEPTQVNLTNFFNAYTSYSPKTAGTFIAAYVIFLITISINSYILYKGISKGIEKVAKIMMPALFIFAVILLGRVITLGIPNPGISEGEVRNWSQITTTLKSHNTPESARTWELLDNKTKMAIDSGFSKFKIEDITNWSVFLAGLKTGKTPVYKHFYNSFDERSQNIIKEWKSGDTINIEAKKTIVLGLNSLIVRKDFYNKEAFKGFSPGSEGTMLIEKGSEESSGVEIRRLNRLLVEVLYPKHVKKSHIVILEGLNGVIENKNLYSPEVFGNINLEGKSKILFEKLLKKGPENLADNDLHKFNRLLVETVFPGAIDTVAVKDISSGFGFMWNPDFSQIGKFEIWLAAAGQIFFTLSLGMGAIACYASYVKKNDDIVSAGLTTALTNESCEVILGGSIAIPLAVAFFGLTAAQMIAKGSGFGLAFISMPLVFTKMPFGQVFGFAWFGLLFFAGITSSLAMGQIVVAFLEELGGLTRKHAVLLAMGTVFILAHLAILGNGGMDAMDYWAGTFGLCLFALVEIVLWVHVFKARRVWRELIRGSKIKLWRGVIYVMAFISPVYLAVIFIGWIYQSGYKVLIMEGIPLEQRITRWIVRGVMLLIFIVIGWISTRNMGKEEEECETGEVVS
ncbi:MAG: hypothetical protein K8T10_11470 [Candidatus Eremiobacteraeota bacterium]|nr:hypothetical protein [Candidatus Eremiobacteraeota bacterium]